MGILVGLVLIAQPPLSSDTGIIGDIRIDGYYENQFSFRLNNGSTNKHCLIDKEVTEVVDWDDVPLLFEQIFNGDKVEIVYLPSSVYEIGYLKVLPRVRVSNFDFAKIQEKWIMEVCKPRRLEDVFNSEELDLVNSLDDKLWKKRQGAFDTIRRMSLSEAAKILFQAPQFVTNKLESKMRLNQLNYFFHSKVFDLEETPSLIFDKVFKNDYR